MKGDAQHHGHVLLTWVPAMRGAEGMRCRASRLCSIPVSSCSFAWHSTSSAMGAERAPSGKGDGASPPAPHIPSCPTHRPSSAPAPRCPSARRSPCPGSWPGWRGQEHCPRAGSASTGPGGTARAAIRSPTPGPCPTSCPRGVTHLRVGSCQTPPLALVMGAEAAHPAGEELWGLDLWDRGKLMGGDTTQHPPQGHRSPSSTLRW